VSSTDHIPVIDVSHLDHDPEVLAALNDACRNWGFFQIVGHGMSEHLLAATHEQMRAFFALPTERKRAIERTAENAWGFYDRELTKNTRDWKQIFDVGPDGGEGNQAGNRAQWPSDLPTFRPVIEGFYAACENVSFRLLSGVMRGLGMPASHLADAFRPHHTSFLRLNYYPACDDPADADAPAGSKDGHFGVNHHTDAGAITVLLQDDQAGLEVYRRGKWTLVEPRADALVVNIGDIVQVWSNDRYPASLHRVLANRNADRYSAPFFFNPAYRVDYAPLPSAVTAEDPAHYRPINWGQFRAARAAGDYADHGEEIQIAHFRLAGVPSPV
jgi:isopenicillin N synthase-like dioxygenase